MEMKEYPRDKNYKITRDGRVYSIRSKKYLKLCDTKKGYKRVSLSENKKYLVHRLVYETFVELLKDDEQINHIDGVKGNNNLDNLEKCSNYENMLHKEKYLLNDEDKKIRSKRMSEIGKKFGKENAKKTQKPVIRMDLEGNELEEYESARIAEASNEQFKYRNISQVCKGDKKTHAGFKWKFK